MTSADMGNGPVNKKNLMQEKFISLLNKLGTKKNSAALVPNYYL